MNAVQNFASHSFSSLRTERTSGLTKMQRWPLLSSVPSSDGKYYTVRCVEGKSSVHASVIATAPPLLGTQHCTHVETVARYYGKIYKPAEVKVETPVVVEAPVKKVRKPRNGLVRKQRNGGLVLVAAKS